MHFQKYLSLDPMKRIYFQSSLLLLFTFFAFSAHAQSSNWLDEPKICVDVLEKTLIHGKWFDFTPSYFVEQKHYVSYFVSKPHEITDSLSFNGTITFMPNGSFVRTFGADGKAIAPQQGNWILDLQHNRLQLSWQFTFKGEVRMASKDWTILQLSESNLILSDQL
jgi:hypothetical protein